MSFLNTALLLLLLVGLVTQASGRTVLPYNPNSSLLQGTGSLDLGVNFQVCVDILRSGQLNGPVPQGCCAALRVIEQTKATLGIPIVCNLTHQAVILGLGLGLGNTATSAILSSNDATVDLSAKIQAGCGVNLGFSLDVNTPC